LNVDTSTLKSKYGNFYASYHIAITLDTSMFAKATDKFMSAEVWPQGVLVRTYFKPRTCSSKCE